MLRPKNQSRRAFLKGALLAGGGAILGTAVVRSHKRSEKTMAELAELEQKRELRDAEYAKKRQVMETKSKKEMNELKESAQRERSVEAILEKKAMASAFNVPKGMVPEQAEKFISKNLSSLVAESKKGISLKQVEINKKYFGEILEKECKKQRVSFSLARRILKGESSWNPKAVSPLGAAGLFQVMPDNYVRQVRYRHNPLIPSENLVVGVRMIADNIKMFDGDIRKAVAAYNYGTNAVKRVVTKHGAKWESNSFGMHRYVKKILGK